MSKRLKLEIIGDLKSMCEHWKWTEEERSNQKRLVEFKWSQDGLTIRATFGVVSTGKPSSGNPRITCYLGVEKCFVETLSTLALLQALLCVYTDSDKRRIQRQLRHYSYTAKFIDWSNLPTALENAIATFVS